MKKFVASIILGAALLGACAPQANIAPTAVPGTPAPGSVVATASKMIDPNAEIAIPDVGQEAPDFEFTLADGTTTKLSDLRGKKVVVNFWATWCEPCREEMPDLDKVQKEYGDNLVVLAVNKAENLERINGFTKEVPVGFPLVANPEGDISQSYGTRTVPNSYFINTDGTVGVREFKIMDYDLIKQNIEALH